jgi:hypothetical protein
VQSGVRAWEESKEGAVLWRVGMGVRVRCTAGLECVGPGHRQGSVWVGPYPRFFLFHLLLWMIFVVTRMNGRESLKLAGDFLSLVSAGSGWGSLETMALV